MCLTSQPVIILAYKKNKTETCTFEPWYIFVTQSNLNKSMNIIDIYRYRTILNIRAIKFVAVTISHSQKDHDIIR